MPTGLPHAVKPALWTLCSHEKQQSGRKANQREREQFYMIKFRGNATSLCAACGEAFDSTRAFDEHRRFKPGTDQRMCLNPATTLRQDGRLTFLSRESDGVTYWRLPARSRDAILPQCETQPYAAHPEGPATAKTPVCGGRREGALA